MLGIVRYRGRFRAFRYVGALVGVMAFRVVAYWGGGWSEEGVKPLSRKYSSFVSKWYV